MTPLLSVFSALSDSALREGIALLPHELAGYSEFVASVRADLAVLKLKALPADSALELRVGSGPEKPDWPEADTLGMGDASTPST